MEDITIIVIPCIVGVILASAIAVTCAFTIKRRNLISVSDVDVSTPGEIPTDNEGSEPFYVNVDDLKADPERLSSSAGGASSRTKTERKKRTEMAHDTQGTLSDTCGEGGRGGHQSEHSLYPSSIRCKTIHDTSDTAIYANCPIDRSHSCARLTQPDRYKDTDHCPMEARPTLERQSGIYVNTNTPAHEGSTATAEPDHYTYLDPLHRSSLLCTQSESDVYDLPYAFIGVRNVPMPKHDHYLNITSAKREKKKKKQTKNVKR